MLIIFVLLLWFLDFSVLASSFRKVANESGSKQSDDGASWRCCCDVVDTSNECARSKLGQDGKPPVFHRWVLQGENGKGPRCCKRMQSCSSVSASEDRNAVMCRSEPSPERKAVDSLIHMSKCSSSLKAYETQIEHVCMHGFNYDDHFIKEMDCQHFAELAMDGLFISGKGSVVDLLTKFVPMWHGRKTPEEGHLMLWNRMPSENERREWATALHAHFDSQTLLAKAVNHKDVDLLKGCEEKVQSKHWKTHSRSLLMQARNSVLLINNGWDVDLGGLWKWMTNTNAKKTIKETIMYRHELVVAAQSPLFFAIQVFARSTGASCSKLMPLLYEHFCKHTEYREMWTEMQFVACADVSDIPRDYVPKKPYGTCYPRPFTACSRPSKGWGPLATFYIQATQIEKSHCDFKPVIKSMLRSFREHCHVWDVRNYFIGSIG